MTSLPRQTGEVQSADADQDAWPLGSLAVGSIVVARTSVDSAAQGTAPAAYTETIPNTKITFDMVPIPAGTFTMGSPDNEAGRGADEGPQHKVTLPAFYMGTKEVTWDEYDEFAFSLDLQRKRKLGLTGPKDAGDAISRPTPPYADESWGWGKEAQPVIGITHYAALKLLRVALGAHGQEIPAADRGRVGVRGARGHDDGLFASATIAATVGDYAWFKANSGEQPHVGGGKKPNAWGLFDMHGNVAEWTADMYDADFYAQGASATAPFNDSGKELYPHAVRGGSWDDEPARLRSAARRSSTEAWSRRDPQNPKSLWWHTDATFVGFRVVAEVDNSAK